MDRSPERSIGGLAPIYEKIQAARKALGENATAVPMSMISVSPEYDELVQSLRTAIPTGEGISRLRFTKEVVNRRYIDDALVYRIA
jgi:uncharacterized short protein YbdD (DUF466 family)